MRHTSLLILAVVLLGGVPAWADDDGSFTVAGTVSAVHCSELMKPPTKIGLGGCEVELEVVAKGERSTMTVSCSDPKVAAACRLLLPGDEALIAGRKQLVGKEATHVALLLDYLQQREGEGMTVPMWMKFGQRVRFEGLWIQFQEVIQDSRCPVDATCIWQGECTVALGFWEAAETPGYIYGTYLGTHRLTLGDDPDAAEVRVQNYVVRLGNMYPEPRTDLPAPEPEDCFLLVEVEHLGD